MENKDIIMFGLQSWDIEIGSNFKNMARIMSRSNKILYVNRPLDQASYLRNRKNKRVQSRLASIWRTEDSLQEKEKNIWVLNPRITLKSINKLPAGKIYKFLNKQNNVKIASEIKNNADKIGFKNPVLIVDNDFLNGLYLKELLQPDIFIYYLRDYLLSQKYFQRHGVISEPQIIKSADVVLTNSLYLEEYARKYNSNSHDIGQGCEVDDFMKTGQPRPADMTNIDFPVIGYAGMLTSARLNISLILFIAESHKEWNIVLVGPQDNDFEESQLHSVSNIFFLGPKEPQQLPSYVRHFDVCINPQILNQMTIGNYPRKIDEYLAAGKPVVATDTEAMKYFEEVTYLCKTPEDYVDKISLALEESVDPKKKQQRMAIAAGHTWEASVDKLYHFSYKKEKK
ncbi:MAG: glycosyltransferase [Ginsengibacter sp.]